MRKEFVVLVCLLGIVAAPDVSAQSGNGSLRGKIVDEQGAAMPGATVTATSPQALTPVVAITDGTGEYRLAIRITDLLAGTSIMRDVHFTVGS